MPLVPISDTDPARLAYAGSIGLNDSIESIQALRDGKKKDWQAKEMNLALEQMKRAFERGYITEEEYNEARRNLGVDNRSWIQRLMFDVPTRFAGALGADVYDENGELKPDPRQHMNRSWGATGSVLETIGDVLSTPLYAVAGLTESNHDAIKRMNKMRREGSYFDVSKEGIATGFETPIGKAGLTIGYSAAPAFALSVFGPAGLAEMYGLAQVSEKDTGLGGISGVQIKIPEGLIPGDSIDAGTFSVGFSPSAFINSWHNRTEFIQFAEKTGLFGDSLAGQLAGGLALDIGLDPLTYATFGVANGSKVKNFARLRELAPVGSKLATHTGEHLTLIGDGLRMFRLSAQHIMKDLQLANGADEIGKAKPLLDAVHTPQMTAMILENLVKNFDTLSAEYMRLQRQGVWRKMSHLFPASEVNRNLLRRAVGKGFTIDEMFQETSHFMTAERGFYSTTNAQKWLGGTGGKFLGLGLEGEKIGRYAEGAAEATNAGDSLLKRATNAGDRFLRSLTGYSNRFFRGMWNRYDQGWDAAPEMVEMVRLSTQAVRMDFEKVVASIYQAKGGMSKADSEIVSKAIEEMYRFEEFGQAGVAAGMTYSDEVLAAVKFAREQFASILEHEVSKDYGVLDLKGYVTRLYNNPNHARLALDAFAKNGEVNIGTGNKFTQHRLIATAADGEELFGKGALETDIWEILERRHRASLTMIHQGELMKYAIQQEGWPAFLIRNIGDGMSNGVLRGLFRRAGYGQQEVIAFDQVYRTTGGRLTELGFKEGDLAHNTDLLRYLMMPNHADEGGKFSEDGLRLADRLQVTEAAKLHAVDLNPYREAIEGTEASVDVIRTSPLPRTQKFSIGAKDRGLMGGAQGTPAGRAAERIEVDIVEAMKMFQDPNHYGWRGVFHPGRSGMADPNAAVKWLRALDAYTKKHLGTQLVGFIPDVDTRMIQALHANGLLPAEQAEKFYLRLGDAVASMSAPMTQRRIIPQLPEVMEILGRRSREAVNYVCDTVPASKRAIAEVYANAGKLGFDDRSASQLLHVMFGEEGMSFQQLSHAQADLVLDMFYKIVDDTAYKRAMGMKIGRETSLLRAGDPIVKRTFKFNRRVKGNPIGEVFDQNLSVRAAEGSVSPRSPAGEMLAETENAVDVIDDGVNATSRIRRNLTKVRAAYDSLRETYAKGASTMEAIKQAYPRDWKEAVQIRENATMLRRFIDLERKVRLHPTDEVRASLAELQPAVKKLLGFEKAGSVVDEAAEMAAAEGARGDDVVIAAKRELANLNSRWRGGVASVAEVSEARGVVILLQKSLDDLVNRSDDALIKGAEATRKNIKHPERLIKQEELPGKIRDAEIEVSSAEKNLGDLLDVSPEAATTASYELANARRKLTNLKAALTKTATAYGERSAGMDAKIEAIRERLAEAQRTLTRLESSTTRPTQAFDKTYNEYMALSRKYNEAMAKQRKTLSRMQKFANSIKAGETEATATLKGGGILDEAEKVMGDGTPAELIQWAKRLLARAKTPEETLRAQGLLEAAKTKMQEWVARGSPIERATREGVGQLRPDAGIMQYDVYLPESTARLLDNFMSPDISPDLRWTRPLAYKMLRTYDRITGVYKANLLLPWGGTWMRNAVSNAAIGFMHNGLALLNPEGGFRNMHDWTRVLWYVMCTQSDLPRAFGPAKQAAIKRWVEAAGKEKIIADIGREMTVAEMAKELNLRGITKGMQTAEGVDILATAGRARGRVVGAMAGGAAGATLGMAAGGGLPGEDSNPLAMLAGAGLGAVAGAAGGRLMGRNPMAGAAIGGVAGAGAANIATGGADYETASYASLMGLAVGAMLGGRRVGSPHAISTALGAGAGAIAGSDVTEGSLGGTLAGAALGAVGGQGIGRAVGKIDRVLPQAKAGWLGGIPVPSMDGVTGLLHSQWAPLMRYGEAATETPFRVAMFLEDFKRSGSMYEAQQNVFRHYNDWGALSPFERRLMRRMVPFYTWSKLAMRQTFVTAIEEPGRLSNIMKVFKGWNMVHDVDPEDVPEFFHEKLALIGEHKIISGFGLPVEEVAEIIAGIPDPDVFFDASKGMEEEILEMQRKWLTRGPFGGVSLFEVHANKDTFTGRPIFADADVGYFRDGERWETAPGWLKTLVGFREKAEGVENADSTVNATIAWALGEVPVSRFVDLCKKLYEMDDEGFRSMNLYTLSRVLLGVNVYKRDPETEKYFVNKGRIDAMMRVLSAAGLAGRTEKNQLKDMNPDDDGARKGRRRSKSGKNDWRD